MRHEHNFTGPDLDPPLEVRVCDEHETDFGWFPDDEGDLKYAMRLRWAEDDGLPYQFQWAECRELSINARGRGWIERIFDRLYWGDGKFRAEVQRLTAKEHG